MITSRVKQVIREDVTPQLNTLAGDIKNLRGELDGWTVRNTYGVGTTIFSGLGYTAVGVKDRVADLEQKVALLLDHLNLCKTDVPAKAVLKKCKEAK